MNAGQRMAEGRCASCLAPPGCFCINGCANADPLAPGQPGATADADLAQHFETACRGFAAYLNTMALRFEIAPALAAWLKAEEKRTASR